MFLKILIYINFLPYKICNNFPIKLNRCRRMFLIITVKGKLWGVIISIISNLKINSSVEKSVYKIASTLCSTKHQKSNVIIIQNVIIGIVFEVYLKSGLIFKATLQSVGVIQVRPTEKSIYDSVRA